MNLVPRKTTSLTPFFRPRLSEEISSLQREMNNLMSSFFNRGELDASQLTGSLHYPAIDLKEKDSMYFLDADLPGMKDSDIEVDLHDNILSIKGEKKSEKESKDGGYVCIERTQGAFRRDIYLDQEVDPASVKAELRDGVLHVEMLKKEPNKTTHKRIPIKH